MADKKQSNKAQSGSARPAGPTTTDKAYEILEKIPEYYSVAQQGNPERVLAQFRPKIVALAGYTVEEKKEAIKILARMAKRAEERKTRQREQQLLRARLMRKQNQKKPLA